MDWDAFLGVWADRYTCKADGSKFTFEQREAFLARFKEANREKSDTKIAGSLGISERAFKNRMGAVYAMVARDYAELQQVTRGKREKLRGILQEAFDQAQVPELPNPIAGYAEVSTLLKRAKLGLERHSGADFYDGTEATWADIAAGCDVERDVQADLLAFVKEQGELGGPLPIGVVLGRSGDGKSTLLMRVAVALHERGDRVLWHDADHLDLNVEALEALSPRRRVVICIDDAQWIDPEVWDRGLRRLHQSRAGVLLLLGARRELWSGSKQIPRSRAVVQEFAIDHLSDAEIDRFLSTYSAADALGKLAYLSPEARVEKFRERADRQLLVMLLEAKHNESLTSYVQKTLEDLAERFGPKVVRACRLVAALHTFGIKFPKRDLATLLGVDELGTEILAKTKGFLVGEGYHHLKTRHAVIAAVVFQNDEDRYLRLSQFIEADLNQSQQYLATLSLVQNLCLQAKEQQLQIEPLRDLLQKAASCLPIRVHICNIWAVMEISLQNRNQAQQLFQIAANTDQDNAVSRQALALMEMSLKKYENAERNFQEATEIDQSHAPTWLAWALMEQNLGNYEKARQLFQKATKVNPSDICSWFFWALMEINLEEYDKAKKLFQIAIDCPRSDSISLESYNNCKASVYQAWTLLELSQGNSSQALKLADHFVQLCQHGHYGYLARGQAHHLSGDWEAAQQDWLSAREILARKLEKSPNDNRLLNQIAEIHTLLGDHEAAQAAIDQSLAVSSPGQQVHAYNALGELRLAQGQPAAARAAWETALRLNPHNLKARNQLQALNP